MGSLSKSLVLKQPSKLPKKSLPTGENLVKPRNLYLTELSYDSEQRKEIKAVLCQLIWFLEELTCLPIFWSRSWKEWAAVPFLLKFGAQTVHGNLGASSSCWFLLPVCCQHPERILRLWAPLGNFQVFKMEVCFFAKLSFDWKECQGYLAWMKHLLCLASPLALQLWWCAEAHLPLRLGPPVPASMSKTAVVLKACFESLQFCWCWGLELQPSRDILLWNGAEQKAAPAMQEFAGSAKDRSWSTGLNFKLKFYFFFLWK